MKEAIGAILIALAQLIATGYDYYEGKKDVQVVEQTQKDEQSIYGLEVPRDSSGAEQTLHAVHVPERTRREASNK